MSAYEVVVAGATGFIGSHILASLRNDGVRVGGFARTAARERDIHTGNLTNPGIFAPLLAGAHTAIQAASYVGDDHKLSRQINVEGTYNLLEGCSRAGIQRVIYVSTAGIYGFGPHYNVGVGQSTPHPASIHSQHRLEAESAVLASGGCVVRPHLVYGRGDRWVLPAIALFIETAGGLPRKGETLQSIISASELGSAIAHLCRNQPENITGKLFHAARPEPVFTWQLASTAMKALHRPAPRKNLRTADAWAIARSLGFSEHQYDLINTDHWYDPGDFWQVCDLSPNVEFKLGEDQTNWYREVLAHKVRR